MCGIISILGILLKIESDFKFPLFSIIPIIRPEGTTWTVKIISI